MEYFREINNPESAFFKPDDDAIEFNELYLNRELQIMFDELNSSISHDETLKAGKQLSIGTSSEPDNELNEYFKYGIEPMKIYFTRCHQSYIKRK